MTECMRCDGPCKCGDKLPIDKDDLEFLRQMRAMGAALVSFENDDMMYERGVGSTNKKAPSEEGAKCQTRTKSLNP